jgi:6-phosphogluconate dehydrogenase (decarboxylating)
MGREMASHLVAAGHTVQAFDVNAKAVEALRLKGAKATTGVIDAAAGADAVILMLPDTPQVEDVIRQDGVLLSNPPDGRLVIDMSTISPRRLSTELAGKGVAMVDAPVSGGPTGAGFVLLRRRRKALQTLQTQISFRTPTMSQKLKPRLVAAFGAGQTATLGRSATLTRPS